MKVTVKKRSFQFVRPSGTSRGILTEKTSWLIVLEESTKRGIGECSLLPGLSPDDRPEFESTLMRVSNALLNGNPLPDLTSWPAIEMGVEMAIRSLKSSDAYTLFPSHFTAGKAKIPINGLVWMGNFDYMKSQIDGLLEAGYNCIKLKIGALDFQTELQLLKYIRNRYNAETIQIRVDANGAFSPQEALNKLNHLCDFDLHSIEQPIAPGQWETMAELCHKSSLPIALDEELIGINSTNNKIKLLSTIKPHYLILKPSLLGGFSASEEWIKCAESQKIGWWVTSALESNLGLNAIAQWTYTLGITKPQGLGTGSLYTNNIEGPLYIDKGSLGLSKSIPWQKEF